MILDNSTTGMTGAQPHSASGINALGEEAPKLDLGKIVRATGVEHVTDVDTWQRKEVSQAIRKAVSHPGPAVVIAHGPCQQLPEMKSREIVPFYIDEKLCTKCDACFKVWCPAILRTDQDFPMIVANDCTACTVCVQICPEDAIVLADAAVPA
jgi:indolepyruvate ferredoxin oxidoreductase alpha subunit